MTAHETPLKHGRRPTQSPVATAAKIFLACIVVLAVSSTSVAAIAVWQTVGRIKPGIQLAQLPGSTAAAIPSVGAIDGEVNLLLVGTDTRTNQGTGFTDSANQNASSGVGNNDVTMLLHVSADHTNATVISIPRDLMVPVPECPDPSGKGTVDATDLAMFNTTLSRGGLSCTVLTVEKMTGLSIPYAAVISFDGVIAMSNAVGGVSVCLATPVTDAYTGLDLAAGEQTLVGDEALAFVRSRHGVGDGSDLGRISNQQVFLSSLMRKITSAGVLANPISLYSLANAALSNMQFSTTLTDPTALVSIALALKNVSLSSLVFVQYPAVTDPDDVNRVIPDATAAKLLNTALQQNKPITLTGKTGIAAEADPSAAATATPAATGTPTPTPTETGAATPTPTPTSTSVSLPTNVSGQTAAEQTCTVGNN
ncbi:LCP family protein [Subtercola sp. RTI3]|nr:LCP family protein [Subtercola sp. RTI3]